MWFSVRTMAELSASSSPSRSRVVRSLARAAERPCARPGCPAPARATLTFAYGTAEVHLDRLSDAVDPQGYDLCARHAARTEAPRGWALTDRRPEDDRATDEPPTPAPRDLGGEATVAVLAAALRAVPEPASTPTVAAADAPAAPGVTGPAPTVPTPAASLPAASAPGRRSVVETLLSGGEAVPTGDARIDEPTLELPAIRAPRRVPAAGDRGPATDW